MNNRDPFDHDNDQLVLSYELLQLMQWIIEYEPEGLKRLIRRALSKGMINNPNQKLNASEHNNAADIQLNIIEFMHLMEILLLEALDDHTTSSVMHKHLVPSINKIDSTVCDDSTLRYSLEHTTTQLEQYPDANPKELLYKELLKRWKPSKKNRKN